MAGKKKPQDGDEPSRGKGQPEAFKPAYVAQAVKLCLLGATDNEMADFWGVSVRTVYRWKLQHEDFCQALKAGKEQADDRVERSLFQRASGYTFVEQQAFKVKTVKYDAGKRVLETEKIEIVEVEKHVPPDTVACIFWLKNRKKGEWRDKLDHEHSGSVDVRGIWAALAERGKATAHAEQPAEVPA